MYIRIKMLRLAAITTAALALLTVLAPATARAAELNSTELADAAAIAFPDSEVTSVVVVECEEPAAVDSQCATLSVDGNAHALEFRGTHLLAGYTVAASGAWELLFTAN